MCKAFPTTLKGPALEWFTSLLPYSIDYFDTLSHLFTIQFAGSRPHQATPLSLLNVRQERDETLRAFIDRFGKVALRMKNLTQEMILQCMALALKPGPFADNVCLQLPATMHELKLRATNYIQMEELKTLQTRFCTNFQPTDRKTIKLPTKVDFRPREARPPRYS